MATFLYIVFVIGIVFVGVSFLITFWCGTRKLVLVTKGAIFTALLFVAGMVLMTISMTNLVSISYNEGSNTGYYYGTRDEKDRIIKSIEIINVDPVNGEVDLAVADEINKYLYNVDSDLMEVTSLGEFELTAYDACEKCCDKKPDDPYYGITATMTKATAGRTIAVDPTVIPYGTKVMINNHVYIAEDCGGAIKGNHIDIFVDTHAEGLQFGRQTAEVYVVNSLVD